MRWSPTHSAITLLMVLLLAACAPSSTQGPTSWLDQPLDGAKLPLELQEVTAHASDADGVASFEFFVDGTLLIQAPAGGGLLADTTVGWNPSGPGVYTISARATDSQGNTGPESTAVVTVGELGGSPTPLPTQEIVTPEAPTPSPTSSPVPTATPVPPTATPVPPTATPEPPTVTPTTPPPPTIVSFQADPAQIQEGACPTVSWAVEGLISEVWFDGEGVGDHDSRDNRCPTETTTYTLLARGPGGERKPHRLRDHGYRGAQHRQCCTVRQLCLLLDRAPGD